MIVISSSNALVDEELQQCLIKNSIYRAALRVISAYGCSNYTSGIGSCLKNGRIVDADFGAYSCCDACTAFDALQKAEKQ